METKITYECVQHDIFKRHVWLYPDGERFAFIVNIQSREFDAHSYPVGRRLTVTITIDEPNQPAALDDDAAGKLNTFMNGGL